LARRYLLFPNVNCLWKLRDWYKGKKYLPHWFQTGYLTQTPHVLQSVYQALLTHDFAVLERQIKAKDYAAKYQGEENKILLIGIEFSQVTRNIVGFEWDKPLHLSK